MNIIEKIRKLVEEECKRIQTFLVMKFGPTTHFFSREIRQASRKETERRRRNR